MARRALADVIARARETKGLTQPQLAGLVGVTAQQIYKWEKARAIPAARQLPALAVALGLDQDQLYELHSDAKDEDIAVVKRDTSELRRALEEALAVVGHFTETYGQFHAEYQRMGTQINQLVEEIAEIKRAVLPPSRPRRERP